MARNKKFRKRSARNLKMLKRKKNDSNRMAEEKKMFTSRGESVCLCIRITNSVDIILFTD